MDHYIHRFLPFRSASLCSGYLVLMLLFSGAASGQSDSIKTGVISLSEYAEKLNAIQQRSEPELKTATELIVEIEDYLTLTENSPANSRDRPRFLAEAKNRWGDAEILVAEILARRDTFTGLFTEVADSYAPHGGLPKSGRTGRMQRIYRKLNEACGSLENKLASVKMRFRKASVVLPPPSGFLGDGDTLAVEAFYTAALADTNKLPRSLGPISVKRLNDGGMLISLSFHNSQARFDLNSSELADIKYLVETLVERTRELLKSGGNLNSIQLYAYLRESEEDLSLIPNAANYSEEFGEGTLQFDYSFVVPQHGKMKERRSLSIVPGTLGFLAATALKLEGLRRAFSEKGIDRDVIDASIYAPVDQKMQERFVIRLVLH